MTQALDFFFSYGSTYSYLSVMRIGNLCADTGVQVRWRPFYARAIMTEQNNRPYVGKPVKTKYMWRDIERRAAQFGIPFNGIPPYPISSSTLAHRAHAVIATGTFTLAKNGKALESTDVNLTWVDRIDAKKTRDLLRDGEAKIKAIVEGLYGYIDAHLLHFGFEVRVRWRMKK